MNRTTLKKMLIGFFLAAFILLLGLFNAGKPRILVLHSYSYDFPWSQRVNTGMKNILKKNRNPVSVKFHYLGLESNLDANRIRNAVNEAQRAIALQKPDLVIAVDDESNQHIARNYAVKGGAKIIFVATLLPPATYGYAGNGNVAGIEERLPLDAVRDAILTARKGKNARIAVLSMDDVTGRAELAQVNSYAWAPHRLIATRGANSFPEWQQFIKQEADLADVLLILSYGGLVRGNGDIREVPSGEIATWIEKNAKPLPLGICSTFAEDGGGLSITPAPVDFGEKSMSMALEWIAAGKDSAPPTVTSSPHFMVGIRKSALEARGITMPAIYIEAARVSDALFQ